MNNTIRLATTMLLFGVVVGGEESHVFTIQIRKPQNRPLLIYKRRTKQHDFTGNVSVGDVLVMNAALLGLR